MRERSKRRHSGQILLLAVLVMTLLMLSTQLYIYEVGKPFDNDDSRPVDDLIFAIQLGSEHVVVGSLANLSETRGESILPTNLEDWTTLVSEHYKSGRIILDYTLNVETPYRSGTRLSWETTGFGITSAVSDFDLSILDQRLETHLSYRVNITTVLQVETVSRTLQDNTTQVEVTFNLSNEGFPALSRNVSVLYRVSSLWEPAVQQSDYRLIDYGNGTYVSTFEVETAQVTVDVSVLAHDLRGIYVQANTTSSITS